MNLVRPKDSDSPAFRLQIERDGLQVSAPLKSQGPLGSKEQTKLLDCHFQAASGGSVSLVCKADGVVQKQLAHPDWLTALVLEVKDGDGVVYQCRMVEGERAVTKGEVQLGFDSEAGVPLDPEECAVELPYPWIEVLSARLTNGKLKRGAGSDNPNSSFQKYGTGQVKMRLHEGKPWLVELGVDLVEIKDGDNPHCVRLAFSMPAVSKLRKLARERRAEWCSCRDEYNRARNAIKGRKEKKRPSEDDKKELADEQAKKKEAQDEMKKREDFIDERMKAMSRFVKGLGALEVRDAWGTPVASVRLDFSKCDPGTMIEKSGAQK